MLLGVASPFCRHQHNFPEGRQYLDSHFPFNERSRTAQGETPSLPDVVDPQNIRRQHFHMLRLVLLCDYCSFIISFQRPLNLVGPSIPTSPSLFTSTTITAGSEYVPLQNCLPPLSFHPRGHCSCLHQHFRPFFLQTYITRAWGMPASFVHTCILLHTL